MKEIITGGALREKLLAGATKLNEIVSVTLGPRGRNVILDRGGTPLITNDGYTIAREVQLNCPIENLASRVMLQSSMQTNNRAGDGTTSSIVLGTEIYKRGLASNMSPVLLKDELMSLVPTIDKIISDLAIPLTSDRIEAIATNSSASPELGKLIADAFTHVGLDGVVTLAENTLGHITLTHVDGAEVPASLVTPHLIENPSTLETIYEDARLLIHDGPIKNLNDLLPILEATHTEKLPLAIIADDFSNEVITAVIANRTRAGLRVLLLKLDELPKRRSATLADIAALTNSTIMPLGEMTLAHLGYISKIIASITSTRIQTCRGGNLPPVDAMSPLQDRIKIIKSQLAACTDDFEKSILQKRLARLTSGIAILSIGAATEIELREKKLRAEDALAAVRAAAIDGIVVGGGITYLHIAKQLNHNERSEWLMSPNRKPFDSHSPKGVHYEILSPALGAIPRKIYENAGQDADEILRVIFEKPSKNPQKTLKFFSHGFDAKNLKFCDMLESNIIDPATVIRQVITNALSAAATLLTTDGAVVNIN